MQINMQMRLAKLKDSDWQVGAVGEGDSGLWKTSWEESHLASSYVLWGRGCELWRPQYRHLESFRHLSFKVCSPGGPFPLSGQWLVLVNTQLNIY